LFVYNAIWVCCNPSFGLATKAKGLQGCEPRESLGVTSHILGNVGSVREWTLTLPRQLPFWEMESWWILEILENNLRGQNSMGLWRFLYHWKALETEMFKMGSHCSFGHLKQNLWLKERSGVKLPIWFPT